MCTYIWLVICYYNFSDIRLSHNLYPTQQLSGHMTWETRVRVYNGQWMSWFPEQCIKQGVPTTSGGLQYMAGHTSLLGWSCELKVQPRASIAMGQGLAQGQRAKW